MAGKPSHDLGERAVSLLATTFVVLAGATACLFIAVAFGEEPSSAASVFVGCFAGIAILLWVMRDRPAQTVRQKYFWFCRPVRKRFQFRLEPRRTARKSVSQPAGPPTAESVREQSGGLNTWVPSELPPERKNRPGS